MMNLERRYMEMRQRLVRRAQLEFRWSDRELEHALDEGSVLRVRRGWYMAADKWRGLALEDRHFALVVAAHEEARKRPLFSHVSAAVLHGLPLYGSRRSQVHTMVGEDARARSTAFVYRHRTSLEPAVSFGPRELRFTALERTVQDVARFETLETAVVVADAALARAARVRRTVEASAVEAWRGSMLDLVEPSGGSRGVASVRRIIRIADPSAESVLESVSRLQLLRLGFDVATQVRVEAPHGGSYFVDFELLGLDILAECDGRQKYAAPGSHDSLEPVERVYREKRREDWIRGVTGKRLVRWGSADVATPERLAERLARFGVPIPRRSAW